MTPSDVRQILLRGGYDPLPLVGKRPIIEGWQKRDQTSAGDIEIWSKLYPYATNTGCLTRRMPSLDIDILNADAAQAVEDLIKDRYGHVLVRIGKPPKRAILFRTEEVFKKITANLTAPNGAGEKIEFLCGRATTRGQWRSPGHRPELSLAWRRARPGLTSGIALH